jgi:hypothetical protein
MLNSPELLTRKAWNTGSPGKSKIHIMRAKKLSSTCHALSAHVLDGGQNFGQVLQRRKVDSHRRLAHVWRVVVGPVADQDQRYGNFVDQIVGAQFDAQMGHILLLCQLQFHLVLFGLQGMDQVVGGQLEEDGVILG